MNKEAWLRLWGFTPGSPEAEAAWEEKLNFRPQRAGFSIFSRMAYEYDCPVTGKHITTKEAHEENLKLHGCHVLETGEKAYNDRRRQEADDELDRKIEATVEEQIDKMPGEKRELLARELSSGIDVQVVRH